MTELKISKDGQQIPGAPAGMKFYNVTPSKVMAATIIGISDDKIYIGVTQSQIPSYKDALKLVKNTIRKMFIINTKR